MGSTASAPASHDGFSRRGFLTARPAPGFRPLPPGISMETLTACTGCGDCVGACPTDILVIRDRRIAIDFSAGECTFCNACANACTQPVFAEPRVMHHVVAISDACLARRGVTCMTCRDACPEEAIRFQPRAGGPFLPVLDAGRCTGCGACVAPCPSAAIAARPRMTTPETITETAHA